MGGLGRLAAWHLPGGPVGPRLRWAATSNIEIGQTTYPVDRGSVGWERRERCDGPTHNRRRVKEGVERGGAQVPLAEEGGLYLDICIGVHEFLVTPCY